MGKQKKRTLTFHTFEKVFAILFGSLFERKRRTTRKERQIKKERLREKETSNKCFEKRLMKKKKKPGWNFERDEKRRTRKEKRFCKGVLATKEAKYL